MSKKITSIGGFISFSCGIDEEWKRIIRRLKVYGIRSTGSKAKDKEILRSIELKKVQMENIVSSKYITISKGEQEKILAKKKEKKGENNPKLTQSNQHGAKLLGEQLYLAIQMKNKKEKK